MDPWASAGQPNCEFQANTIPCLSKWKKVIKGTNTGKATPEVCEADPWPPYTPVHVHMHTPTRVYTHREGSY